MQEGPIVIDLTVASEMDEDIAPQEAEPAGEAPVDAKPAGEDLRGASSEGPLAWPVLRIWVRLRGASSEGPLAWLGPLAGACPGPVRHLSGLCPVLVRGLVGLS